MRASDAKNKKQGVDGEGGVPLTSLMDAMTIILLFLLQSFSTDGNLIKKDENSDLSVSVSNKKAKNLAEVVVSSKEIKFKMDVTSEPNEAWLTKIDEKFLKDTTNIVIPNLLKGLEEKAKQIDSTQAELRKAEIDEGKIAELAKRTILIEIDKKTQYRLITRVMATCGEAGFSDIQLLTYGK